MQFFFTTQGSRAVTFSRGCYYRCHINNSELLNAAVSMFFHRKSPLCFWRGVAPAQHRDLTRKNDGKPGIFPRGRHGGVVVIMSNKFGSGVLARIL